MHKGHLYELNMCWTLDLTAKKTNIKPKRFPPSMRLQYYTENSIQDDLMFMKLSSESRILAYRLNHGQPIRKENRWSSAKVSAASNAIIFTNSLTFSVALLRWRERLSATRYARKTVSSENSLPSVSYARYLLLLSFLCTVSYFVFHHEARSLSICIDKWKHLDLCTI